MPNDGFHDESNLFAEHEFVAAFELIENREEARRLARVYASQREGSDEGPPWVLSPDLLDLLSLVSEDCAERVRQILRLTHEEARSRRLAFAKRLNQGAS